MVVLPVPELAGRPARIGTVHVPEYAERNNWWSLLCALRSLPAREPVVVVNADLCVDPAALTAFLDDARGQEADGLLAVDVERPVTQESMKVAVGADGSLTAIGKLGVDAPLGEYVGLLMARGDVLEALQAELEAFEREPGAHDQWYEGAIGRSASAGASWQVWPMSDPGWVEIDDDADLAQAEDLVGTR